MKLRLSGREFQRDKVEPYPECLMDKIEPAGTICGVLREMFQKSDDADIKLLARTGVAMAKKIAKKLNYYHDKYEG